MPDTTAVKQHLTAAMGALPYREDLEPGSQEWRDWMAVRDKICGAVTRLTTMERAKK